ncbi:hypothetical protein QUB70_29340, partial [Microcoleus sp. A003_D6]|uniref:hypothetical protein n=1 Tax=Microcoleus sp. A003_D6 TaxID=3055266 RepID=UPI002FD726ED
NAKTSLWLPQRSLGHLRLLQNRDAPIGRSVHINWMQRSSKYFTDVEGESLLAVYQFLAIYARDKFVLFFSIAGD